MVAHLIRHWWRRWVGNESQECAGDALARNPIFGGWSNGA